MKLLQMLNHKELLDDVKHFSLKNMTLIKTKPEHKILYKIVSTMGCLHNINSRKVQETSDNNQVQQQSSNNSNYDFSDLD